jgi:hypothetical protein
MGFCIFSWNPKMLMYFQLFHIVVITYQRFNVKVFSYFKKPTNLYNIFIGFLILKSSKSMFNLRYNVNGRHYGLIMKPKKGFESLFVENILILKL